MFVLRVAAVAALFVLIGAPAAPAAAQPAQLTVRLWNFGFGPQPIRLAAGKPVTLTFVNQSGSGHDFAARVFSQHARVPPGAAPGGAIAPDAHESRTTPLAPAAGTYEVHCSHFLHKQMGMSDTIVV